LATSTRITVNTRPDIMVPAIESSGFFIVFILVKVDDRRWVRL